MAGSNSAAEIKMRKLMGDKVIEDFLHSETWRKIERDLVMLGTSAYKTRALLWWERVLLWNPCNDFVKLDDLVTYVDPMKVVIDG